MPFDRGNSNDGGRDVDDWLGGVGEIDWSADVHGRTRPSGKTGGPATYRRFAKGIPDGAQSSHHAAEHPAAAAIRRRRAVGLLVLLAMLGGVIWLAVAALGGGESTGETTQATTVQQPSTSTSTPTAPTTTTTTTTPAVTTPPLTVALPVGEKLRRDASGDVVKQVQEGLTALGFEPGPVDGDYGPVTEAAVVAFQQSKGLATDGVVGVNTARELNAALAELPAAGSAG